MVGPFGGTTAATALRAILLHPALLGEPVALTVNYAAAMAEGPFSVTAKPVRTNRSTQHWTVELSQADATATRCGDDGHRRHGRAPRDLEPTTRPCPR
jgi:acyl-coenzyme A thioesterase PaaI-like protein